MPATLESSARFIESLEIESPPSMETIQETSTTGTPTFAQEEQAIAIGSQIAGFTQKVPLDLRSPITNSLLLAQLAANKAIPEGRPAAEWREAYRSVLLQSGWIFEAAEVGIQKLDATQLEVHKAIIPVLTAIFGGGVVGTVPIVIQILEGLSEVDKNKPWITLFNRESRRASFTQFQVGQIESAENGNPLLTTVFIELNAETAVTQILFFRFSSSEGSLYHNKFGVSIDPELLRAVAAPIAAKVANHVTTFVQGIEI